MSNLNHFSILDVDMKLSIVSTMYYSAPYIQEFYERISKSAQEITDQYEIILVNDGSPDNSLEIALRLREQDSRVIVVDFSRNFGHHKAIMSGLSFAQGKEVFLIDIDLEEDPELLIDFHSKLQEAPDCDVVYSRKQTRRGPLHDRIFGYFFFRVVNFLSGEKMPTDVGRVRLMSNRYVQSLLRFREHEIYFSGILYATGYKWIPVTIEKRFKGSSTYNFWKKVDIIVNAITSFSNMPLRAIFAIGSFISILAGFYFIYNVTSQLFFKKLAGWTSVMASIWLLGGLTIMFLGTIGIYVAKIFIETKNRPYTIIRDVYGSNIRTCPTCGQACDTLPGHMH
jgi:putative glycosyltransferase